MKLRGIEFGPCLDAPGIRGWFDNRYWYHRLPIVNGWLSFDGSTFVEKTTTLESRIPPDGGNMEIEKEYPWSPIERFPKAIWLGLRSGRTVNSVGLSGPGANTMLSCLKMAKNRKHQPMQLSFMSLAATLEGRIKEFASFVNMLLKIWIEIGRPKWGLQINISCPNTGHDPAKLVEDALSMLEVARPLADAGIAIIVKLNILAPIDAVVRISSHDVCDALCVSNAIPFGELPDAIDWKRIFPQGSPIKNRIASYGNGGYSGPELLPLVAQFIRRAKGSGVSKPWNAGGGIRSAKDVRYLVDYGNLKRGKDSIFFASAAMVRPWRVPGIIKEAHRLLGT